MSQQNLRAVQAARRAHLNWVMKADALIQGIPLNEEQVPIRHTDCKFGQWYHSADDEVRSLSAYQAIDVPHQCLHETYHAIFTLLMQAEDTSLFSRLIGRAARQSEERQKAAKILFDRLQAHSHEVVAHLDELEAQLEAVS